jgi:ABC-type phosphate transport system auxiliary subunit
MFPLSIGMWINIGMAVLALGGIAYGKYESYKYDSYIVSQKELVQKKQEESQAKTDQIRKDKDAQIKAINNQLVDAISELRKRSSRSQSSANGQNGTGATLYAEDAEFLIREASRADTIRTALDACYKQYDAIR